MQLPKDFIDRTKQILGDEWTDFVAALDTESPTSIRVNSGKTSILPNFDKVKWNGTGYYLPQRPQFTFDPLFHAGTYYVQEASSMIIGKAIEQLIEGDVKCLDLCAAPGGKSTLISSMISDDSLLISNEIIRSRANILSENMMKWGNSNQIVTNNKSEDFSDLSHFFDLILVDAPCSGEGMFRKDPQAIEEWSIDNVNICAFRQKEVLSAIWNTLKPEGYLLYSTCTYNREENEEMISWVLENYDAAIVELDIEKEWGIASSMVDGKATYRFLPHKTKGEGLYFAVIKKGKGETENWKLRQNKKEKKQKTNLNPADYNLYLKDAGKYIYIESKGMINAFPSIYSEDLRLIQDKLNIISLGICLGQTKGKDFIPHQSLALSNQLNQDVFSTVDVDWQTAIAYLRTEAITLSDTPKGIVLLTYKNTPLGFVKNLGNRANNLYPNEWRIRSANLPASVVDVLSAGLE